MAAAKVYVVPVPGCEQEVEALKAKARTLGFVVVCDGKPLSDYESCIKSANFVLLPLCAAASQDGSLDEIFAEVRAIGGKIVGVWPDGAPSSVLPASLSTFGYSVIRAEVADLKRVLVDGERIWLEPNGKPRKAPPTPRHKG